MRQNISRDEFDELPPLNRLFLALWKQKKQQNQTKELSFGELVELSFALTPDLRFDTPSERTTFNNSLQYDEILIAWDGREPIETLWYEVNQKLKRRIFQFLITQH